MTPGEGKEKEEERAGISGQPYSGNPIRHRALRHSLSKNRRSPRRGQHRGSRLGGNLLPEGLREALHVGGKVALVAQELDVGAVDLDAALLALGNVLVAAEGGEAPVLGDDDLLAAGELWFVSMRGTRWN